LTETQVRPTRLLAIGGVVYVANRIVEALDRSRTTVLFVGSGNGMSNLIRRLAMQPRSIFQGLGVVADRPDGDGSFGLETPWLGSLADLSMVVARERPELVVVDSRNDALPKLLLDGRRSRHRVVDVTEFSEYAFGRVPLEGLSDEWFMNVARLWQRPHSAVAKRAFDVIVAFVGLLLTAILSPLLFVLVRRTPGPIILRQIRVGENGKLFTMYKFRSMTQEAEEPGRPVWAQLDDSRLTDVGSLLRSRRLDELPQFWNVLKGDMSIVGPRPERPEFVHALRERVPFWTSRHLNKPGITGWAQVRIGYTRDVTSAGDKLAHDLWYLRHRSLLVDVMICVRTIPKLLSRDAAPYPVADGG
jgi:exopolysaccharide biosynthesis polyprenyl glycosylphosphotransferase